MIRSILEQLFCSLCASCRIKQRKYEDYKCAVRRLSQFSIDPRGGYAAFLGLRDSDPTKQAALYIDTLRGEYDPNLGVHRVYHVAFVIYGDSGAICRTLVQRAGLAENAVIAGNAAWLGGDSALHGAITQKIFRSQPNTNLPIGITMPFAGNVPVLIPGTPEDINFGNIDAVGFEG